MPCKLQPTRRRTCSLHKRNNNERRERNKKGRARTNEARVANYAPSVHFQKKMVGRVRGEAPAGLISSFLSTSPRFVFPQGRKRCSDKVSRAESLQNQEENTGIKTRSSHEAADLSGARNPTSGESSLGRRTARRITGSPRSQRAV